jgi:hypothetical protein
VGAAVIALLANYGVLLVRAVREVRWVPEAEPAVE